VEGKHDAARRVLREEFATPCEESPIETYDVGEDQRSKCVLHGREKESAAGIVR